MPYDSSNLFARLIQGDVPCEKIVDTQYALAFRDIAPQAPQHFLVVPKGSYAHFHDFHEKGTVEEILGFYQAIQEVLHQENLMTDGYRLITNCGNHGGQEIPHYHVHILSGKSLGPLVSH